MTPTKTLPEDVGVIGGLRERIERLKPKAVSDKKRRDDERTAKQKDYAEDIALLEEFIFSSSDSTSLSKTSYGSISVIAKGAKILSKFNINELNNEKREESADDKIK